MECKVEKLEHFRHIFLEFNRGAKAAKTARNICVVDGDDATGEHGKKWFSRFKEDRFDISGHQRRFLH